MTVWETLGYGLSLLGIGFILWVAIRTTVRTLKQKGILKQKTFSLRPWNKE